MLIADCENGSTSVCKKQEVQIGLKRTQESVWEGYAVTFRVQYYTEQVPSWSCQCSIREPYKDSHTCNFIYNSQKLKTTHISINRCMGKHSLAYQCKGTLFHNRNEGPIDSHNISTEIITLKQKEDKKSNTEWFSVYKIPENSN